MAAGRYFAVTGFASHRDYALYRYNNSKQYVQAVNDYAAVLAADPAAFAGYHRWDVYYNRPARRSGVLRTPCLLLILGSPGSDAGSSFATLAVAMLERLAHGLWPVRRVSGDGLHRERALGRLGLKGVIPFPERRHQRRGLLVVPVGGAGPNAAQEATHHRASRNYRHHNRGN
jgi:hypothetical protein